MEKVIDIEDRIPTLKLRRKKRTNRKFIVLILLFFLVLAVLLYFQSPYSDIKNITVNGAKLADEQYYLDASTLAPGKSMWGFTVKEISPDLLTQLLNELFKYDAASVAIDGSRIVHTTAIRGHQWENNGEQCSTVFATIRNLCWDNDI
ncbi:Cell division protein DivIB [Lysinibacillus sphaericus]